jgi:hypothetical protein
VTLLLLLVFTCESKGVALGQGIVAGLDLVDFRGMLMHPALLSTELGELYSITNHLPDSMECHFFHDDLCCIA